MKVLGAGRDRLVPGVLLLLLAGALVWLTVHWVGVFSAAGEARVPAAVSVYDPAVLAERVAVAQLFGRPTGAEPPPDTSRVSALNIKLKGVFSGSAGPGYAIVNTGAGADTYVKVGGEVLPQVTLASVHPTHIVVNRGGILERVELEERTRAVGRGPRTPGSAFPESLPPPSGVVPGAPANAKSRVPAGQAGANARKAAVAPGGRGARAAGSALSQVPAGSVAERLGMQPGDVLLNVNGQPVSSPAELEAVTGQVTPGTELQVDVMRGGVPLQLRLQPSD